MYVARMGEGEDLPVYAMRCDGDPGKQVNQGKKSKMGKGKGGVCLSIYLPICLRTYFISLSIHLSLYQSIQNTYLTYIKYQIKAHTYIHAHAGANPTLRAIDIVVLSFPPPGVHY